MSSDPIKNILTILYDDLTSRVYCILKSAKRMKRTDLENKLREQGLTNMQDLSKCIGKLVKEDFIRNDNQKIKNQPNDGINKKYQKGATQIQILIFNNVSINVIKNKYENMKEKLKNDFKEREKRKYVCPKCGEQPIDQNLASRTNFKCRNCERNLVNISEDLSDLRKKCNEILEVLDELFKEEENNSNTGINSYYNNYLTSKYGKNFNNNNHTNETFEEDPDSYIFKTLNHLQDKGKMNFYELVEGFISKKK